MSDEQILDSALVERLRADDLSALEVLFERYRAQVYRTAYAITHDTAASDDILQDTMLKVYKHANRIDVNLPLAPWLYRVTVNLSYTWTTRSRNRWVSIENMVDHLVSPIRHAPDKVAENNEQSARIERALDTLQFNQRIVVILHYLEDMDLQQIAEVLELPVGTVKSRLYYARENLRRQLGSMDWETGIAHGYA